MLMDSMQPYAEELAALLPSRFTFKQNTTYWFIRDEDLRAQDMRSNGEYMWCQQASAWKFLALLCDEYGVTDIKAFDNESLEEATFRALIVAVKAASGDRVRTPEELDKHTRRNLLKQLVKLAPKHICARYNDTYDLISFSDLKPDAWDINLRDTRRICLTNDFKSICGSLVLWDELERNWHLSLKSATVSDSTKMEIYDGYEVHLLQRVDADVVPLEHTVWGRTRCESIVRAAIAAWSN